jgi:hypothetical protein
MVSNLRQFFESLVKEAIQKKWKVEELRPKFRAGFESLLNCYNYFSMETTDELYSKVLNSSSTSMLRPNESAEDCVERLKKEMKLVIDRGLPVPLDEDGDIFLIGADSSLLTDKDQRFQHFASYYSNMLPRLLAEEEECSLGLQLSPDLKIEPEEEYGKYLFM